MPVQTRSQTRAILADLYLKAQEVNIGIEKLLNSTADLLKPTEDKLGL